MSVNDRLRVGLIGYGAWGSHHARAITSTPTAALIAIAGHSDASVARARNDHPDITVYADYKTMLERESIDAVSVVVPSDRHFEIAQAVLESGRHLLLEKPMTLRLDDSKQLLTLANARNVKLAIGHELRMSSLWGKAKHLLDTGAIGDPLYVLIELWRRPYRLGSEGWRYDINRVGSWILEEPIHFFDLARWYLSSAGNPESVMALANGRQPGHPELHDNFSAMVQFPQNRYAVISQTLAGWEHHQVVKITGTAGAMVARWSGAMDRTFDARHQLQLQRGDQLEDIALDRPSGEVYELVEQMSAFVHAVQTGSPLPCTGEDGYWSMGICLKAAESLRLGQPVSLKDLSNG